MRKTKPKTKKIKTPKTLIFVPIVKKYTFADLKRDVNKLNPEQLKKQVYALKENDSEQIMGLETLSDDIYCHKQDDEQCGTIETLKSCYDDFKKSDYKKGTKKGTPFLYIHF